MDTERQRCCCPFVYSIMLISSLLVAKREVEIFPSIWIHLRAFFFPFSLSNCCFTPSTQPTMLPIHVQLSSLFILYALPVSKMLISLDASLGLGKFQSEAMAKNALPHLTCLVLHGFFLPQRGDGMETIFACPIPP